MFTYRQQGSDVHLRVILHEIAQPSITEISLKIAHLKFHSNLPGPSELISRNVAIT